MRSAPGVERVEAADELGPNGARSVFVITSASASAACRAASAKRSRLCGAVDRVDQGDDAREAQPLVEHRVGAEREQDRRRVGEAAGLDDDAAKPPDLAGVAPVDQAAQACARDPRAPRSTGSRPAVRAPALDEIDEVMVDRDLADLVDDDGGVGERRRDAARGAAASFCRCRESRSAASSEGFPVRPRSTSSPRLSGTFCALRGRTALHLCVFGR